VKLKEIASEDIPLVAGWLGDPANYNWLDFGRGVQRVDEVALRVMLQRDIHLLRTFTTDDDDRPVGLVGLSDINPSFGTATVWTVLGDKSAARRRVTTRAVGGLLTVGFRDLGLAAINAWTLEINRGGQRLIEALNFRFFGRQRRCHLMTGRYYDRLWYDMLAEEHQEFEA
jgi:RimJ/RimL family protein N-acetyltransferase